MEAAVGHRRASMHPNYREPSKRTIRNHRLTVGRTKAGREMRLLRRRAIDVLAATAIAGAVVATWTLSPAEVRAIPVVPEKKNQRTLESIVSLWERHENAGPLAVMPIRRSYLAEAWGSGHRGLFAGLYAADEFESFDDYEAFAWYTSSIQQFLIRDGEVDLDWFVPERKEEGAARLFEHLESRAVLTGREAQQAVVELDLPEEFSWISDLKFRAVSLYASDDGLELSADSDEGFLALFAIAE